MFLGASACGQEDASQRGFITKPKSTVVIEYGHLQLILRGFFKQTEMYLGALLNFLEQSNEFCLPLVNFQRGTFFNTFSAKTDLRFTKKTQEFPPSLLMTSAGIICFSENHRVDEHYV